MIAPETIDRVREAADIVQIIGEHVNLRKMGQDWRGPCPFHQGTHRNFSVSPKKGMYYCFVCHESGDVFTFVEKRLGLDWPAAVRHIADKVGVEVREIDARPDQADEREPLWEANAAAAEFFRAQLWESDGARDARSYLAQRGITREVAERFGLGFAPRDPQAMRAQLGAQGYDEARLLDAGLLVRREESGELRPRFRGRLMFPIQDARGRHAGFGGRVIGEGEPKYLNSAESRTFSKSRLLYGLAWARHAIRKEERVMVVEGYFDVIRLAAAGIEWVVAPLGTALTEQQAQILHRLTKSALLLYDSDSAGLKATFRAGDELLRHGFSVQVVTLPEGEDPDTFVARHGAERLLQHAAGAIDLFERKIQLLERAGWFADLRRKRRALDRLLPTIRATADPLTRDIYIARAAEISGVSKELLQREVARAADVPREQEAHGHAPPPEEPPPWPSEQEGRREWRGGARKGKGDRPRFRRDGPSYERRAPDVRIDAAQRRAAERGAAAERTLLLVMLHHRGHIEPLLDRVGPDDFEEPRHRELFRALLDEGADAPVERLAERLSPEAASLMQRMLERQPEVMDVDLQKIIEDSLRKLRERDLRDRLAELFREMKGRPDSAPEKDALLREMMALRDELRLLHEQV
ncbi:MAG TPA: DNA primase [Gemmatimonadaceae bacterium]|nr:DNA primase [Gemmatimonadaceae bacterium]